MTQELNCIIEKELKNFKNSNIKNEDFFKSCSEIYYKGKIQGADIRVENIEFFKNDIFASEFLGEKFYNIIINKIEEIACCAFIEYKDSGEELKRFSYLCKVIDGIVKNKNKEIDDENKKTLFKCFIENLNASEINKGKTKKTKNIFENIFLKFEQKNYENEEILSIPYEIILNKNNEKKIFSGFSMINYLYTPHNAFFDVSEDYFRALEHCWISYNFDYITNLMSFFENPKQYKFEINSLLSLRESLKNISFFYFYLEDDFNFIDIKDIPNNDIENFINSSHSDEEKMLASLRFFRNKWGAHKDKDFHNNGNFKKVENFIKENENFILSIVDKIIDVKIKTSLILGMDLSTRASHYKTRILRKDLKKESQFDYLKNDLLSLIDFYFDSYKEHLLNNLNKDCVLENSLEMFNSISKEKFEKVFKNNNLMPMKMQVGCIYKDKIKVVPSGNFSIDDLEKIKEEVKEIICDLYENKG